MAQVSKSAHKIPQDNEDGSSDIKFHMEIGTRNFKQACDKMVEWVRENQIIPEQVISFTVHETKLNDAEPMIVLFYYSKRVIAAY